jgi:hypothetical protein
VSDCELCQASRFTEWFHEDEECWIAECESCVVPMVVWKTHDHRPDDQTRQRLHDRLVEVVSRFFVDEVYIDDNMRAIPDHYHAHARGKGKWGRQPLERRPGV